MRRAYRRGFAAIVLGLVGGCSGGPTPIPDASTAEAEVYAKRCGACHSVPHPKRHSMNRWGPIVALMERRMAEQQMPALSDYSRSAILGYLKQHARE